MSNHCLNFECLLLFFFLQFHLKLLFAFLSFRLFSHQPVAEGEHPYNPSRNGLLCSAAAENTLACFSACLPASYCTVSQQETEFNTEQWYVSACRPTQQKIPQWGAMTTSLCNCHRGASVSILYVSLPHQQPVSPIGDLTQHPHRRDVTGPQLHSGPGCHVWDVVYNLPPQRCTNSNTSFWKPSSFTCSN